MVSEIDDAAGRYFNRSSECYHRSEATLGLPRMLVCGECALDLIANDFFWASVSIMDKCATLMCIACKSNRYLTCLNNKLYHVLPPFTPGFLSPCQAGLIRQEQMKAWLQYCNTPDLVLKEPHHDDCSQTEMSLGFREHQDQVLGRYKSLLNRATAMHDIISQGESSCQTS